MIIARYLIESLLDIVTGPSYRQLNGELDSPGHLPKITLLLAEYVRSEFGY